MDVNHEALREAVSKARTSRPMTDEERIAQAFADATASPRSEVLALSQADLDAIEAERQKQLRKALAYSRMLGGEPVQ